MHRLAGIDVQHQTRRRARLDFTFNDGVVVPQGLRRFEGLLVRAAFEAQQSRLVAVAEAAYIAFHIGLEGVIGGLDPDHQLALRTDCKAAEQQDHTAGKSSWKRHRRGC